MGTFFNRKVTKSFPFGCDIALGTNNNGKKTNGKNKSSFEGLITSKKIETMIIVAANGKTVQAAFWT